MKTEGPCVTSRYARQSTTVGQRSNVCSLRVGLARAYEAFASEEEAEGRLAQLTFNDWLDLRKSYVIAMAGLDESQDGLYRASTSAAHYCGPGASYFPDKGFSAARTLAHS
jgi:hypothetical protein